MWYSRAEFITSVLLKMSFILNFETFFKLLTFLLKFFALLPIFDGKSRYLAFFYPTLWWFYLSNDLILLLATINALYTNDGDLLLASNSWMEITSVAESIIILICFRAQKLRLKSLLRLTKSCLKDSNFSVSLENKNVLILEQVVVVLLYVSPVILRTFKPTAFASNEFLSTARYSLPVTSDVLNFFLYGHQFCVLLHESAFFVTDITILLLLYFCATRLRALERRITNLKSRREIEEFTQEHIEVLRLVNETNKFVGILAVKTTICFMSFSISAGILLIKGTDHVLLLQPFMIIVLSYFRLFVSADGCETVIAAIHDLHAAFYSRAWQLDRDVTVITKVIIMQKCQDPPTISIGGYRFLFDRSFMLQILRMTISYFLTIKALVSTL